MKIDRNDNDETLAELQQRLAQRTDAERCEVLIKSLNRSVSNFLRKRRRGQAMLKSLRPEQRLVLPVRSGGVTEALLLKASTAYEKGIITGTQFNTIDVAHRSGFRIEDADLLAKIRGV